jgi:epoxyqueuosine reductase
MKGKLDNWLFGCDVCQDVCPWNRFSTPHNNEELKPVNEILQFKEKDWEEMTEESFKIIFKNSPLKRTKYGGIKRNLKFIKSN